MLSPFESLNRYWRLLAIYLRPHSIRMIGLAIVLIVIIGVQLATPLVASRFIDRATQGDPISALILLALITIGLALVAQLASVAETWLAEAVSWAATNELRTDLAAHLLQLDAAFHSSHTLGEMIERVDGDVSTLARFFSRFVVSILGNGLLMIGVLVLLFRVDWRVGLGLSAFVALALFVMIRIRNRATPLWAANRQASADFYGFLGEYVGGLEDVRSSGAGAFVLRRCAEIMRSWLRITRRAEMMGYAMVASSQGLFALGTAFAFGASAVLFREGTLTLGTVYLIFRYTDMLRQPTEQIRNEMQDFQQADASIGRIESLFAEQASIRDGTSADLPPGPLAVDLERVSFGYSAERSILHDIDVHVAPGRVLGIVGRTGSGKTTLTRLLPRFHDPQTGTVRLGGVDIRDVRLNALRSRIGLVTQDIHLFDATLRHNLTLFDDSVPDDRLLEVIAAVGLGDWFRDLPDGLDSMLGSDASGLSAGQAQVLTCARVLLREPDLVILDEASSRLDPATERLLHTALGTLLRGRTGIIVAHRLATFSYADDMLVLEDGKVMEHGPRIELETDPDSHYARLLRFAAEEVLA